ncbi:hypothetical protein CTEN210_01057 [Chaetoceros tenuissimus]|uniref:Rhamnogalacturonase A/B/Epimerase-like pectate lyase domain-containing protein n=1 Tax=Chaetoceros tenuissimus TaxID=426638 RepID=A0AAD3GZI6_9STRA|nr:hypothetical protein CTEN210_01057 [Chaetoceros tenuissimus]
MRDALSTPVIFALLSIAVASIFLSLQQRNEIQILHQELKEQKAFFHQHHDISPTSKINQEAVNIHSSSSQSATRYLYVTGLVGDGQADDTRPIKRALKQASKGNRNAIVVLPKGDFKITKPLKIKGGVKLVGQGYGPNPLQIKFQHGGSVLISCVGEGYAIDITEHSAGVENLGITESRSEECVDRSSGVRVYANSTLVESVTMSNVLIYQFMNGTSLSLEAENQGGIAYASFKDLRIRHAKVGIKLEAKDTGSFVNSNAFHDGAISGGITDIAVHASGPGACNDNLFAGMVIEPPSTNIAHVYVTGPKTNVRMNDIRLEGTNMAEDKPLVIIDDDSYGNVMNGLLGHTFIKADLNRNPEITFATNKMVGLQASTLNQFWNSAFNGLDASSNSLPGWTLENLDASYDTNEEELHPNQRIISLSYSSSQVGKLKPLTVNKSPIHSFASFGIYAKTNVQGSIIAAMKSSGGGTISSSSHTGSGTWEFIGMSSLYDKTGGALPYFQITGDVNVTSPTFVYGQSQLSPGSDLLSSSYAQMSGLFVNNVIDVELQEGDQWVIQKGGNIFELQTTTSTETPCTTSYQQIRRINAGSERFPKGSIITLLFPACGDCIKCIQVVDNAYITLASGSLFPTSVVSKPTNIVLISEGDGTWKELSRNGGS